MQFSILKKKTLQRGNIVWSWDAWQNIIFYSDTLGYLYDSLAQFETQTVVGNSASTSQATYQPSSRDTRSNQNHQDVKLQRTTIPSFSGDFKSWTSFHDLFNSRNYTILNRLSLAWELLQKMFGNKKLLLNSEMDRFMSSPRATFKHRISSSSFGHFQWMYHSL